MGEFTEVLERARLERQEAHEAPRPATRHPRQARAAHALREAPRAAAPRPDPASVIPFPNAPKPAPNAPPRRGLLRGRPVAVPIPGTRRRPWRARAVALDRPGPAAEAYRHVAVRVCRELEQRGGNSVLLTSALGREGRTTTACNLALALATVSVGERVALLDLDLRRPGVQHGLGIPAAAGIERVLTGEAPLEAVGLRTVSPSVDVFPALLRVAAAHELLVGRRLAEMVAALTKSYRIVVVDAPPVVPVPDVPLILEHVGACIPIARAGVTRRASFEQMLELLPKDKVLGQLLCDASLLPSNGRYEY